MPTEAPLTTRARRREPRTQADLGAARRGRIHRVADELAKKLGRRPTQNELAAAGGWSPRTLARDLKALADAGKPVATQQTTGMMRAAERRASMLPFLRKWIAEHEGRAPSQAELADAYGVSRRTVQVDLDVLETEGLISITREPGSPMNWVTVLDPA